MKSHPERQEMDRILNSGRLCNTCCRLSQVANVTHVLMHTQAEDFAGGWGLGVGHFISSHGDKAHMAENWQEQKLPPLQERAVWGRMVLPASSCSSDDILFCSV